MKMGLTSHPSPSTFTIESGHQCRFQIIFFLLYEDLILF